MDILFASATELAAAIRSREVSALEVLDSCLDRISELNPTLNAIITMDADAARARARAADAALARGESWGPLHGVPFTLKDAHSTAGMRTTAGCEALEENIPDHDSTVTARLKSAGLLVSNYGAVGLRMVTHNDIGDADVERALEIVAATVPDMLAGRVDRAAD